jgi:hypothetical protein
MRRHATHQTPQRLTLFSHGVNGTCSHMTCFTCAVKSHNLQSRLTGHTTCKTYAPEVTKWLPSGFRKIRTRVSHAVNMTCFFTASPCLKNKNTHSLSWSRPSDSQISVTVTNSRNVWRWHELRRQVHPWRRLVSHSGLLLPAPGDLVALRPKSGQTYNNKNSTQLEEFSGKSINSSYA